MFPHKLSMPHIETIEEAEGFRFGFSFEQEDKYNKVDVERSPDRFRMGYHEVFLEGYDYRPLEDLAESLEDRNYHLVDAEATGLTYYSRDGKTEVYIDEVLDAEDEVCRIRILRGELMEDELPGVEDKIRALFYEMTLN